MRRIIYKKAVGMAERETVGQVPVIPVVLMVLGALMVGSVAGPIVAYLLFTSPRLNQSSELISPLPVSYRSADNRTLPLVLGAGASVVEPVVYGSLDYRRPQNWFPSADPAVKEFQEITHYNLSIPKLKIEEAVVAVGGDDLSKSLIHYPGTANPGELGASVIFGHSVLRQFYNPKNYMTIFSTIMTLSGGDEIKISYNGVNYRYRVIDKFEVKPEDVDILRQSYDGRYLKLITCTPEGTYLRRGVILAELL